MKIYVKASGNVPHITDLFDYIDTIVFVDDARTFNMSAIAASVDDDLRAIANMSDDEVHSITDPATLELINQKYPERLSEEQIEILKEYFYQKYVISRDDVNKIIAMLRECNEVNILRIKKNRSFANKFADMKQRALGIIHSLKVTDYLESTKNSNENGFGDELIVFVKEVKTADDEVKTLKIYIKIDVTQTVEDGGTIAVVSFHDAKTDEPVYPYVKYQLSAR